LYREKKEKEEGMYIYEAVVREGACTV